MRTIQHIVIHCTATKEALDFSASDIDRWHRQKGWAGIGYHYVVRLNGVIEKGRPDWKIGAHVRGYNRKSLGVVYVGGVDSRLAPKDTRTDAQKWALQALVKELKTKHPHAEVLGHRDFSPDKNKNGVLEPFEWMKACPCFDVKKEFNFKHK